MAFFDEMNAKPNGQHVYDIFLEPLEDGRYLHNGKTFYLKPCLWIFAGTSGPAASATEKEHPSNKAVDFESRLTRPVMHLGGAEGPLRELRSNEERDLAALREVEQVYLGVATIRQVFSDVTKISKKVLEAFRLIPEKVGPRGIRRFVRSFEYIQYGRVMGNNLPDRWNEQMEVNDQLFGRWKEEQDGEHLLVEIWSRPER